MARSYQQQLDAVDTAIARIEEGGQSYTIGGRSLTRADLPELYKERASLQRLAARAERGGISIRRGVFSGG